MKMDNTKLRNYAFDVFDYDTGTLCGLEKYLEWIESLVLDRELLRAVVYLILITEYHENGNKNRERKGNGKR